MFLQKDFIHVQSLKFWQTDPSSVVWDTVRGTNKKANCVDSDIPRDKHCHNILWTDPNFFHIHIALMEEHYLFPQGRRHQVHFPVTLKNRMRKGGYRDDSPKWDLPLEIQPLKGKSQVVSRPVQDLSCKWHRFAYTLFHSTSLHPFPISPCHWNKHPNSRSKWLGLHLGNQWDQLYTKCCKVHKVNQPNKRSRAAAQPPQQPLGLYRATADLLAGTCAPWTAMPSPLLLLSSGVGCQHLQDDSQKPKL